MLVIMANWVLMGKGKNHKISSIKSNTLSAIAILFFIFIFIDNVAKIIIQLFNHLYRLSTFLLVYRNTIQSQCLFISGLFFFFNTAETEG